MTQAPHNRAGRRCLAGVHAGAGQRDHRDALCFERCILVQLGQTDSRGNADAFAEVGKLQHGSEYFTVERCADIRIGGIADTDDAADIEKLNFIARLELFWQVSGIAS